MKKTTTKKASSAVPVSKPDSKKASGGSTASKPKAPKKSPSKVIAIDKACEAALGKLQELNIDSALQAEIVWCLGSYQNDQNPAGLYVMAKRALAIFTVELASKTKGVTAKLVEDLEKAIGSN